MPSKTENDRIGKNRRTARLAAGLDKGLLSYATAASAAGVGMLALAQPAEAKIVYTPTDIPITVNGGAVPVDLNHDGVTDFSFYNASGTCEKRKHVRRKEGCSFAYMDLIPAQAGNAVGSSQSFNGAQCAAELRVGHVIGAGKKFKSNYLDLFQAEAISYTGVVNCPWTGKGNTGGFTALKFTIGGETHYGWAHVVLTSTGPVLRGYAYETAVGQSIKAGATKDAEDADASQVPVLPGPQPASLGMLALGAPGVAVWRRREEIIN
jgi:hypothetical protein